MASQMPSLSEWLIEKRSLRGWSQRELSRRAEVSSATISKIEDGSTNASRKMIFSLAGALGVDPNPALAIMGLAPVDYEGRDKEYASMMRSPLADYEIVKIVKNGKEEIRYQYPGIEAEGGMVWMTTKEPRTEEHIEKMRLGLRDAFEGKN